MDIVSSVTLRLYKVTALSYTFAQSDSNAKMTLGQSF
jgi:hypothetical protein